MGKLIIVDGDKAKAAHAQIAQMLESDPVLSQQIQEMESSFAKEKTRRRAEHAEKSKAEKEAN